MKFPDAIFWLIFGAMVLFFIFNIARRGGIKGAMFNAEITGTIGEVETIGEKLMSQRIKVHRLLRNGAPLIGIEVVSKSVGSYEMLPLALTGKQAQQLAALLEQAQKSP